MVALVTRAGRAAQRLQEGGRVAPDLGPALVRREAAAGGAKFVLTPEGTNVLEQRRDRRDAAIKDEEADVAVLGLPDNDWGEKVAAVVVPAGSPPAAGTQSL